MPMVAPAEPFERSGEPIERAYLRRSRTARAWQPGVDPLQNGGSKARGQPVPVEKEEQKSEFLLSSEFCVRRREWAPKLLRMNDSTNASDWSMELSVVLVW